jgi:hypothetical protein
MRIALLDSRAFFLYISHARYNQLADGVAHNHSDVGSNPTLATKLGEK